MATGVRLGNSEKVDSNSSCGNTSYTRNTSNRRNASNKNDNGNSKTSSNSKVDDRKSDNAINRREVNSSGLLATAGTLDQ